MATIYQSPSGDDDTGDGSTGSPYQTFTKTLPLLDPGDTLILKDGDYSVASGTGLPSDIRGPSASGGLGVNDGTAGNVITVKAENDRVPHLHNLGFGSVFLMDRVNYWTVEGLYLSSLETTSGGSSDGYPFRAKDCTNITLKRCLFYQNNAWTNSHLCAFEDGSNFLVEDCEGYKFTRHAFIFSGGASNGTLRRCYANSRDYATPTGGHSNPDGTGGQGDPRAVTRGDGAFVCYPASNCLIENCISEGNMSGGNFQASGLNIDNRLLGCIAIETVMGTQVQARGNTTTRMVQNLTVDNFLQIDGGGEFDRFLCRTSKNTEIKHFSSFNSAGDAFIADRNSSQSGDGIYSVAVENSSVHTAGNRGIALVTNATGDFTYSINYCNVYNASSTNYTPSDGRLTNSTTIDPQVGPDRVHIPAEIDLIDAAYNWTQVGATNEWYVRTSGDADPKLPDPTITTGSGRSGVNINSSLATKGTLGSLNVDEWDFGDPDSLGYDTIVVRITGGTDPQLEAAGYVTINGSPLSLAGLNGEDIGAVILYKYVDGELTTDGLWNPNTGVWTEAGAEVTGINDVSTSSPCLGDVNERLNVTSNGGRLPQGYDPMPGPTANPPVNAYTTPSSVSAGTVVSITASVSDPDADIATTVLTMSSSQAKVTPTSGVTIT